MTHIIHRDPRKALPVAEYGEGCFIIDTTGRRYFDASGGAAVSCLGHVHPDVVTAVAKQLHTLEYAHTSFFTTEAAETLANLLATNSPPGLSNVYFVSSGSEAMETALKMARQYHVDNGEPQRWRIVARRQSYHGNTLGALSVGGNMGRRSLYQPLLLDVRHVSPCFAYHGQAIGESDEAYGTRLAGELEGAIQTLGHETVSAFVAETVVGATLGAAPAVPGYFKKIREVCDRYRVLLILDEVMCGMGRTGSYHAFEQEAIVPDLLCLAKGLGGGYQPIGAVVAQDHVVNVINAGSGAFQHGHTYVGHPVACAAALAVQRVVHRDKLVLRCANLGQYLGDVLRKRFDTHPHVGDIRGRGLFWALELVREREGAIPFDPESKLHARLKDMAHDRGLLCYPGGGTVDGERGDHVLLAPPFIATEADLDWVVDILSDAIDESIREVRAKH